jgi:hypothetical protein
MNYTTIGNVLESILNTVPNIEVVYNYEPDELKVFPALTIQAAGHLGEFRSTNSNMRIFHFVLRLYLPAMNSRDEQVEADVRSLMDGVVAAIDSNPTLNNTCSFAEPSNARIQPADREVPVTVAEIDIMAKAFVART